MRRESNRNGNPKSLRQLAKELGVSHSYLSQVINGKRPPSEKVLTTLLTSGLIESAISSYNEREWQRSSVVEQRTHKPLVVGSNPSAASLKLKSGWAAEIYGSRPKNSTRAIKSLPVILQGRVPLIRKHFFQAQSLSSSSFFSPSNFFIWVIS